MARSVLALAERSRPSRSTTVAICLIGGSVVRTITRLPSLDGLFYSPYGIFRSPTWAYWIFLSAAFVATAALACAHTSPAGAAEEPVATRVRRAAVGLGLLAAALPIAIAVMEALSAAASEPDGDVSLWPLASGPSVFAAVVWLGLSALTGKAEPLWAFALWGGVIVGLATLIYAVPATLAVTAFLVATAYGRGGTWPSRVVGSEHDDERRHVRLPMPVLRLRGDGSPRPLPAVRARRALDGRPRRGSRPDRDRRGADGRHGVLDLRDR